MHNTITEYKRMHSKTISWNDNWILIFICFEGRLLFEPSASSSSSFIVTSFLIQMLRWIRSSSRVEFFIFLRDLLWMMRAWSSVSSISPSLLMNRASSSSWSLLKCNHFLLEHIPWINEFHNPGRPFKVAITTSAFFTASSCSFERLLWLHGLCILDLHILQLVSLGHILIFFFPSNSLKFRKTFNIIACNR